MEPGCAKRLLLLFALGIATVQSAAAVVTPRLASDGAGYLLIRIDDTTDPKRLLAQHLNANGGADAATDLGAATIDFNGNNVGFAARYPWYSVAFGASTYLVAWRQGENVVVRRISPSGAMLDSEPTVLGKAMQSGPAISDQAIAWNGKVFSVTWQSADGTLVVSFVSEGGGVSAPVAILPFPQYLDLAGRIIWDGKHLLLSYGFYTYIGPPCHCSWPAGVVLLRVDSEGKLIDSPPASPKYFPTLDLFSFGYLPRWHLAANGFDVVMVAEKPESPVQGLYSPFSTAAFMIHPQGPLLQIEKPVALFDWFQLTFSDVTWDGRNFAATWLYGSDRSPSWIATTKFTSDGVIFDSRVAEVGNANQSFSPPAIAASTPDQALVMTWESATTAGRLETLRETDMAAMPPRPKAPVILSAAGFYPRTIVNWAFEGSDAEGFVIEEIYPEVSYIAVVAVAGSMDRTAVVQSSAKTFRVRALNSGGISDPSPAFRVTAGLRRRTSIR